MDWNETALVTAAQEEAEYPAGEGRRDTEAFGEKQGEAKAGVESTGGAEASGAEVGAEASGAEADSGQQVKRRRWIWALAGLASAGAVGILTAYALPYLCVRKSVTVEAGQAVQDVSELLYWENGKAEILSGIEAGEKLKHAGDRSVVVGIGDARVAVTLHVVDTVPPRVELLEKSVYAGKAIAAEEFVKEITDETDCIVEYVQEPAWEETGIQTVSLTVTDEGGNCIQKDAVLEIMADTAPPVISGVKEITITEGDSFSYEEGVTVKDNCDEHVPLAVDDSSADTDVPGDYEIIYSAEDEAGNRAEERTLLHVKKADRTPPVIEGVKEITILKGESVSYKRGVTVTDDTDEEVALEIDNSAADTETPGDYPIIYSAVDQAGNRTEVKTTLHVKEYTAKSDTGVEITEELVLAQADKILASITNDSMSDYERIEAIYDYVNKSIAYSNGTPKTTWVEGAYYGLVQSKGDCFAFAMASKCLLTRAGITNIDIERVRMGDSMHFWNLVDIGEGWHHFDTCRRGDGVTFFYLTDAELMEYSEAHKTSIYPNGSHYYDRSLYPEIP